MQIDILTTFPKMFEGPLTESIVKRAQEAGIVKIVMHNLRDWTTDTHHTTDDHPFGGGPGMIMMVEPIDKALTELRAKKGTTGQKIILTSAKGSLYTQRTAETWSTLDRLVIICGHFEGVDERVADNLVDEEVRIGDYVLTGGELAAMVLADSVVRLLPGALGEETSLKEESHSQEGYLEYPQYTRPADYRGWKVPDILLSGNHAQIEQWKKEHAQKA